MQIYNSASSGVVSFRLENKTYTLGPKKYVTLPNRLLSEAEKIIEQFAQLELVYEQTSAGAMEFADEAARENMSPTETFLLHKVYGELHRFRSQFIDRLLNKCMSWLCHTGVHTTVGGAATEDIPAPGIKGGCTAIVTMSEVGAVPVTIVSAKCDTDKITVTFSGDPSNDHKVNYAVAVSSK